MVEFLRLMLPNATEATKQQAKDTISSSKVRNLPDLNTSN